MSTDVFPRKRNYKEKIVDHLEKNPLGVAINELYDVCSRHITESELREILEGMDCIYDSVKTRGRTKLIVRLRL